MSVDYSSDLSYASDKLCGSYVKYDGEIVDVNCWEDEDIFHVFSNTKGGINVPLNELDLSPIELGYINFGIKAGYCRRYPKRHWKQGTRPANASMYVAGQKKSFPSLCTPEATAMLLDQYPSIENVIELIVNKEKISMAFSKHFALRMNPKSGQVYLDYQDKQVGKLCMESFTVGLDPKFSFLNEVLQESLK